MHQIRFLVSVRLSLCPFVSWMEFDTIAAYRHADSKDHTSWRQPGGAALTDFHSEDPSELRHSTINTVMVLLLLFCHC